MSWTRKHTGVALFVGAILYSATFLSAEVLGSSQLARSLCTDIVGPIRFSAVNRQQCLSRKWAARFLGSKTWSATFLFAFAWDVAASVGRTHPPLAAPA